MGMSEDLKSILKKAEIKRVAERITKKELCNIYKFNYNYYMNCVSDRNSPSKKMVDDLMEYLNTPTSVVYERVFKSREAETSFHDALDIFSGELEVMMDKLKANQTFQLTEEEESALIYYARAKEEWEKKFGTIFKRQEDEVKEKVASIKAEISSQWSQDEENQDYIDQLQANLYEYEGEIRNIKREKESSRNTYIDEIVRRMNSKGR